jgi:hypothetical protein
MRIQFIAFIRIFRWALKLVLGLWVILSSSRLALERGLPLRLLIASGVLAFLAWCATDREVKPEDVRNSEGEITVWSVFSFVSVRVILWALVWFLSVWIVPHLPDFFLTGWRFPLTPLAVAFWQWIALLMALQYVSHVLSATPDTTLVTVMAALGSKSAKQLLDDSPRHFS